MELLRTEQDVFTPTEILKALEDYETNRVPMLTKWWDYYRAKNPTILDRKKVDENNPDNRTVVSYGRKLVNTFQGYGYRPGYITYKSEKEQYLEALNHTFRLNDEIVATSRAGRDTGAFGEGYELFYIETENGEEETEAPAQAEPMWINVDPRKMILYYDHSPKPKKKIGIYYYPISEDLHRVEVNYPDTIVKYERIKQANGEWSLKQISSQVNFYGEVPVVAYYLGDERMGIIEPVETLIDDYDVLTSDSMNEFDKFANAYLILKRMHLTQPDKMDTVSMSRALRRLKRSRVLEMADEKSDAKFLLKDTPKDFVEWLTNTIRDEIHKQSHVPDFMSEKLGGDLSGVAVQRMMFDFENLVSSAQGDFDLGLMDRMGLITIIYDKGKRGIEGDPADVTINHKRNVPQDTKEFAETAVLMKNAGFSSWLVAETMPDDIIPDVQVELDRQREDREQAFADVEMFRGNEEEEDEDIEKDADEV